MSVRLNRKLELEALSRTDDGAGGFSGTWAPLGTHWGAVAPAAGRLETGEGGARARMSYRITIRAVPPASPSRPRPGQRFRDGDRVFAIQAVGDDRDARYLVCLADEEVGA